ncbi:MAG: TOBE domain-containing protein, partial [Dermatophilaceae bacterium]
LVTHDPEEAALLADEILIIDNGQLLQAGPRSEVYNRPASPQVARLLGIQNLNHATVASPTAITTGRLLLTADTARLPRGTDVLWCIRPEHVTITDDGAYRATVTDIADIGTLTTLTLQLADGPELRARTTDTLCLDATDTCRVDLNPDNITVWPGLSQ